MSTNDRRVALQAVPDFADSEAVQSDEEREHQVVEDAERKHAEWIKKLPAGSVWLLGFQNALRALRRWLRAHRRSG